MNSQTRSISKDEILFPSDVKQMLGADTDEIKKLCKEHKISPKRDSKTGKTFFLRNDVETLLEIKKLYDKTQVIEGNQASQNKLQVQNETKISLEAEFKGFMEKLIETQEGIVNKLSGVIDDKLDGMDEVVVELIRAKTENENLRHKLNDLLKENYNYQKQLNTFKSVGLGLYIKKTEEEL